MKRTGLAAHVVPAVHGGAGVSVGEQQPIQTYSHGWVYLTSDGQTVPVESDVA